MKRIVIFSFLSIFFFPILVFAEAGQTLKIGDYECHISATKLSQNLVVTGEIYGGEPSESLRVRVHLADENGLSTTVKAVIERYRGSGRFSVKKSQNSGGNRWTTTNISLSN